MLEQAEDLSWCFWNRRHALPWMLQFLAGIVVMIWEGSITFLCAIDIWISWEVLLLREIWAEEPICNFALFQENSSAAFGQLIHSEQVLQAGLLASSFEKASQIIGR